MRRLLALVVVGCALASSISAPAKACGGALYDDDDRAVGRARYALERGDYALARRLAAEAEHEVVGDGTPARARRIGAMAWVRDETAPEAELRRAKQRLLMVRIDKPVHDVQSASDLGEALARFPEHADEARALLEPLADKDLIGSPATYMALARVTNDPAVKLRSVERCQMMIDDADYLGSCRLGFLDSAFLPTRHKQSAVIAIAGTVSGFTIFAFLGAAFGALRRRRR